jgi:hypothetical protein
MIEDRAETPLALAQPFLRLLALRDVAQMRREGDIAADRNLGDGRLDGELLAVLSETRDLAALAHELRGDLARAEAPHLGEVAFAEARRDEHVERLAENILGAVAEDSFGGEIEEGDLLIGVDGDDAVLRDHQNARGAQMRLLESVLLLPPRRVVAEGDEEAAFAVEPCLGDAHVDGHLAPVLRLADEVQKARLRVVGLGGPARQPLHGVRAAVWLLRHQHGDVAADYLFGAVAEQLFGRRIDEGDFAGRRRDDDGLRHVRDDGAKEFGRLGVSGACLLRVAHRSFSLPTEEKPCPGGKPGQGSFVTRRLR